MTETTTVEGPMMFWTGTEPDYWEKFSQSPLEIFQPLRKAQIVAWFFTIGGLRDLVGRGSAYEKKLLRWRKDDLIELVFFYERNRMDALNDRRGAIAATKRKSAVARGEDTRQLLQVAETTAPISGTPKFSRSAR